jgi:glycosyltransferase involved in cell wall biosynthesis
VEVGGAYGGSIRALETYLAHSDQSRFQHDVLLYYPTPGSERLVKHATQVSTVFKGGPWQPRAGSPRRLLRRRVGHRARRVLPARLFASAAEYLTLVGHLPLVARLYRTIRSGDYDLVHANNTFSYQAPTILAVQCLGLPLIGHVRNPVHNSLLAKALMAQADCIVTVADFFRSDLAAWHGSTPIHTCRDGVESPVVDATAARALRRSLVPPGGCLIGSVGRLDPQKGYPYLIDAARDLVARRRNVRFVVAGDGPSRQCLETLIASLGLCDHFLLCGFRTDVPEFLAALDVFVSSSLWEGLPLAVVEAMLLERPVVATNVGGTSEVVLDGRTGYLVPPRDPTALSAAVLTILSDPLGAGRMVRAAQAQVTSLLDAGSAARAFDLQVEGVLNRTRRR